MIDDIVKSIVAEAEKVKNPDPVSRLYNVSMRVSIAICYLMDSIRNQQRRSNQDDNKR